MKFVLSAFPEYDISYDVKTKVIHIHGNIKVKDFVRLKAMLKSTSAVIENIKVN